MDSIDYYAILQVDPQATQEQIRLAYKRLALEMHPDLSTHPHANRLMQQLNEAYEVLGSVEKRAEYDRQRRAPAAAAPAAEQPPPATQASQTSPSRRRAWRVRRTAQAPTRPRAAPPPSAPPPADIPMDPESRRVARRKRQKWLARQLQILAVTVLFTAILFGWTLISGEFNLWVILLLVAPVAYVLILFIRLIRSQTKG